MLENDGDHSTGHMTSETKEHSDRAYLPLANNMPIITILC